MSIITTSLRYTNLSYIQYLFHVKQFNYFFSLNFINITILNTSKKFKTNN